MEAIDKLQATTYPSIESLSFSDATSLGALLAKALNILVAPPPSSTAYDPARPTLPSEIISLILHQLTAQPYTPIDLARCCLVSKSFLPFARERLYHTLHLRVEDQQCDEDGQPLDLGNSASRGSDLAINFKKLASTLPRHPHLGTLVQGLSVTFTNATDEMDHTSALEVVSIILDACRAQRIALEGVGVQEGTSFLRMLWKSRQKFQHLEIGTLQGDEAGEAALLRFLAEQVTLKVLSLEWDGAADRLPPLPFQLHDFSLKGYQSNQFTLRLVSAFTLHSAASLTRLALPLDLSAERYTPPDLPRFTKLGDLKLSLHCSVVQPSDAPDRDRCRALFESLPSSVVSLTLEAASNSGALSVPLNSLPPSVISLTLGLAYLSPASLLAYLRSGSSSYLRRLRYPTMERDEAQDKQWSDDSKADVIAVLEEQGIEGN